MSRWLTCAICGRRKAVGIMSAQAWGAVDEGSQIAHACPECQQEHADWHDRLKRLVNTSS